MGRETCKYCRSYFGDLPIVPRSCDCCPVGGGRSRDVFKTGAALDKGDSMKHEDAVEWLDEMESALVRAEMARKDIDLIVTMRAVRKMLESEVRNVRKEKRE